MAQTNELKELIRIADAVEGGDGNSSLSWDAIGDGTISTTAADILDADPSRKAVLLHNSSSETLVVSFGSTASATSGLYRIEAGQTLIEKESFVTERLSAIALSGTVNYSLRMA